MWHLQPDTEKVLKDRTIDVELHRRQPLWAEAHRADPFPGAKLRVLHRYIDPGIVSQEVAQKVGLLLAVVAALWPAGEEVAIAAALFDDPKILGSEADFLAQFPDERLFQRLAFVHAALRELPGVADIDALADQDFALVIPQDSRDVLLDSRLCLTHEL